MPSAVLIQYIRRSGAHFISSGPSPAALPVLEQCGQRFSRSLTNPEKGTASQGALPLREPSAMSQAPPPSFLPAAYALIKKFPHLDRFASCMTAYTE